MKYIQPYGESDPNAPYKDRNTGAGEPGSRVPAKAIEYPQREIQTVIQDAGLMPDENSATQLNEAIDLKIALATSGGPDPLNDLLNLLRARMLVYPEIMTSDGRFNLSVPATGTVRIPVGITLRHRGCYDEVTAQQDFTTLANKTYHLRKRWTGGSPSWSLVDVSDSGYNPSALAETDASFDSSYDDMLSHKVVTNPSNVATITPLTNKDRLSATVTMTAGAMSDSGINNARQSQTAVYNLARTPARKGFTRTFMSTNSTAANDDRDEYIYASYPSGQVFEIPATRYGSTFIYGVDYMTGALLSLSVGA